jgi:putative transposase
MSHYRRDHTPGGIYFFTVALEHRDTGLLVEHVDHLRTVYQRVQNQLPFRTIAICVLPNHLHSIWQLPEGDADYPLRWSKIKSGFSRLLPPVEHTSSKTRRREKGIWQRRYWEHRIRDENDLARHVDYIHVNPVKHGLTPFVCDWPWSSFHRYVARGWLPEDWAGEGADTEGRYGE